MLICLEVFSVGRILGLLMGLWNSADLTFKLPPPGPTGVTPAMIGATDWFLLMLKVYYCEPEFPIFTWSIRFEASMFCRSSVPFVLDGMKTFDWAMFGLVLIGMKPGGMFLFVGMNSFDPIGVVMVCLSEF